jgi:hypothetical protein
MKIFSGIEDHCRRGRRASPIGLGRVYGNDPIERIEGKPTRSNPNRK